MIIRSIELSDFRNYDTLSIGFDSDINILYGDNAQGKTNILEAAYLCSTTKSHKGSKDKEMIKMGCNEAHIRMLVEKNDMRHTIDMHLKRHKSKGIAIDSVPIHKSSELIGLVPIVFFSPEDLSIIKNGPGERRRFIDMELCQLDKIYLYNLTCYNKIINQRNNLLKQIGFNRELLDTLCIWDEQLAEFGKKIISRRKLFIDELNGILYSIHKKLSGQKEELVIRYVPNVEAEFLYEKLGQTTERDIALKTTGTGPHRDDVVFMVKDIDIRKFGSQGQQRTAALSLKLAEIELLRRTIKDNPVLLLDDVLSELDRNRQNYLLDSIKDIQTIITCTGLEEFVNNRIQMNRIYKVVEGTVCAENS
ncbi:DNA replication/repair protein RecF [Velocimicrobium porci]|uniref:DNA replication and repair protein RecF n=1 Tax=Velocimicrobium porci TaxID=2606634 RepID=A0A6L5XWG9_9FIRM|nr:DNA replication/repair protein RecF [Velocimicrobium porci]MSS62969.1 DNA replication/repair protein RecF [Velocimicrobium porci]